LLFFYILITMRVIYVLALALLSALPTYAYNGNHLQARNAYLEARDSYLEAREAYMEELDGLHARDSYWKREMRSLNFGHRRLSNLV